MPAEYAMEDLKSWAGGRKGAGPVGGGEPAPGAPPAGGAVTEEVAEDEMFAESSAPEAMRAAADQIETCFDGLKAVDYMSASKGVQKKVAMAMDSVKEIAAELREVADALEADSAQVEVEDDEEEEPEEEEDDLEDLDAEDDEEDEDL
jgi:hypothetical protein